MSTSHLEYSILLVVKHLFERGRSAACQLSTKQIISSVFWKLLVIDLEDEDDDKEEEENCEHCIEVISTWNEIYHMNTD